MAATTQAADVLQALECHALLTAQITLEGVVIGGVPQFLKVTVLQILDPGVRIHTGLSQDGFGPS